MKELTLAQVMERVGINTQNVEAKLDQVRIQAESWIERAPAPETLKEFVRHFIRSATDLNLPVRDLAIWVAAVAYVILPLDFISDLIPLLGWTDDMTVMGFALKSLRKHRKRGFSDGAAPGVPGSE